MDEVPGSPGGHRVGGGDEAGAAVLDHRLGRVRLDGAPSLRPKLERAPDPGRACGQLRHHGVAGFLVEDYLKRYQAIAAARESAPESLADAYRNVKDLVLTIDGLQPEKGHETLYVVRELRLKRVWFATPLLSSSGPEVKSVLEQADAWAKRLGKPVRLSISDKQKAFVTGIAEVFAGVPHRYCSNHFLRDLAKPVLERDSHAKVQMRRKVRGPASGGAERPRRTPQELEPLRILGRGGTADALGIGLCGTDGGVGGPGRGAFRGTGHRPQYAAGIRGILNDDQGGPLDPPGLRMAEALGEVRASLQRCVGSKKGGPAIAS